MFESLKLTDLPERQCGILRGSSNTRPAVWVVEEDGVQAVVKDYSCRRSLFMATYGRLQVWRESKALRKLDGLKGVPKLYRTMGGLALVMERIAGRPLESLEDKGEVPETFFHALKNLVDRCHQKGVAHCDLKRSPNTLFGDDGRPYIIDWGASISESEFRFYPLNLIYQRFLQDDYKAIVKLKLRHVPSAVTPREMARYYERSIAERVIRAIRDWFRGLIKKIA